MAISLASPPTPARQAGVVLALIATVAVNGLATALPINGVTTAEISDSFPLLITPPGYVFAIWGLIYLGLIVYAGFQALPAQGANPRLRAAAPWFLLSCAGNVAWLLLWHYGFYLSTLPAMLVVLASLLRAYLALRAGGAPGGAEAWLARAPFSIYLGWICVATLVNGGVFLYQLGWQDTGAVGVAATIALLAAGAGLTWLFAWRYRDAVLPLVIVWAASGIAQKSVSAGPLATAAWLAAAAALAAAAYAAYRALRAA